MATQWARRGFTAISVLALAGALSVVALPFFASTELVRDRIVQEFESWSGYRVSVGGAPRISVWPSVKAELPDVTLSGWDDDEKRPVLRSDRVEIELSAIAALGGDIIPIRVRFIRPSIRVERSDQALPALISQPRGRPGWAIGSARAAIDRDPANPSIANLPDQAIGVVEFDDARILEVSARSDRETELAKNLGGLIQWSGYDRSLSVSASGEVNGETVEVDARVSQPLLLIAGGSTALTFTVDSTPLKMSFDGSADISEPLFVDGDIQLSTPSPREFLHWTGAGGEQAIAVGSTSISGRMRGKLNSLKIDDAEISLAENPGMGVLEVSFGEDNPALSGTLAFENLDLVSFLSALAISPSPTGGPNGDVSSPAIGRLNLDLRLSADNASAGPVALSDVAAAVQITDSLATFDISDASGFDGSISTGFRIDREAGQETGEFRLLATDIDSGDFAAALGVERMALNARGKLSVILNGPVAMPGAFLRTAGGSISATFDTGTIADFDLNGFVKRAGDGGFFALNEVAEGTLAFERAELKASVANGVVSIEKAEAKTADQILTLAGIVPYTGRSLALSGTVAPIDDEGTVADMIFFVGGSWGSPFISAVLPPPFAE